MVYIAKIAINIDVLHCKRYFDVDHKTIRQLMMPKLLDEVFQWFVTPFYCYVHSVILHQQLHNISLFINVFSSFRILYSQFLHFLRIENELFFLSLFCLIFNYFFEEFSFIHVRNEQCRMGGNNLALLFRSPFICEFIKMIVK